MVTAQGVNLSLSLVSEFNLNASRIFQVLMFVRRLHGSQDKMPKKPVCQPKRLRVFLFGDYGNDRIHYSVEAF